ncbi:hypothetical protein DYH09_22665 [bacterium CPR1]|nr:hypothetical protein [bacterium CPR1]
MFAYCPDLVDEILQCPAPLRDYLLQEIGKLAILESLEDAVSGCFLPDRVSQSVVPHVISCFQTIGGSTVDGRIF